MKGHQRKNQIYEAHDCLRPMTDITEVRGRSEVLLERNDYAEAHDRSADLGPMIFSLSWI
jgi:hypothetical protein